MTNLDDLFSEEGMSVEEPKAAAPAEVKPEPKVEKEPEPPVEDEVEEELPPLQHNQKPGAYPIENHLDFPGLDEAWHSHISHETESFESKFLHMLLVLGLLIGFMFVASWALKRMMKAKITHHNTSSSIKVLETRYLSPRATLYLVEIEGQSLLIAESPTAVTYLKTFRLHDEETEEVEPTHHFPSQEQPTI